MTDTKSRLSLTVAEAAEMVGISVDTMKKHMKATDDTHLPFRNAGGRTPVVRLVDLERWLERRPVI